MKRVIIFILCVSLPMLAGCGRFAKKKDSAEEIPSMTEEASLSETESIDGLAAALDEAATQAPLAEDPLAQEASVSTDNALTQTIATAYLKPSTENIQTALKNAGYYTGSIDGKIGPKSKQAIRDFQAAYNLKSDGKVGPVTWGVLSQYLNQSVASATLSAD